MGNLENTEAWFLPRGGTAAAARGVFAECSYSSRERLKKKKKKIHKAEPTEHDISTCSSFSAASAASVPHEWNHVLRHFDSKLSRTTGGREITLCRARTAYVILLQTIEGREITLCRARTAHVILLQAIEGREITLCRARTAHFIFILNCSTACKKCNKTVGILAASVSIRQWHSNFIGFSFQWLCYVKHTFFLNSVKSYRNTLCIVCIFCLFGLYTKSMHNKYISCFHFILFPSPFPRTQYKND